jgi:biotin carboxyl carrier protein
VSKTVRSPVTGVINEILRKPGEPVNLAEPIIIIESMKMHMEVCAEIEGVLAEILVCKGDSVDEGQPLLTIREPL